MLIEVSLGIPIVMVLQDHRVPACRRFVQQGQNCFHFLLGGSGERHNLIGKPLQIPLGRNLPADSVHQENGGGDEQDVEETPRELKEGMAPHMHLASRPALSRAKLMKSKPRRQSKPSPTIASTGNLSWGFIYIVGVAGLGSRCSVSTLAGPDEHACCSPVWVAVPFGTTISGGWREHHRVAKRSM